MITVGTRNTSKAQLGRKGDCLEMMRYSLSQHPIMGRVFARHLNSRGVGFADDLNIYASLKTALKVLVEMRQRLGEDAKLSFNMTKVKNYIRSNGLSSRAVGREKVRGE